MHPPSVPHQQQDCLEREAEHGANSTVAGSYSESLIKPYSGLSDLLLEFSRGADDAPTDPPAWLRKTGRDRRASPSARTPASPSECHPRPNPASASAFAEYRPRANGCSARANHAVNHVTCRLLDTLPALQLPSWHRAGAVAQVIVESRPQLPGELPSQRTTTSCTLTRAI